MVADLPAVTLPDAFVTPLVAPDLAVSIPRARRRLGRLVADALFAVHSSAARPEVVLLDAAVIFTVCFTAWPTLRAAVLIAALLPLSGIVVGLYADRDPISCRGVLWYPTRLLSAVGLAALLGLISGLNLRSINARGYLYGALALFAIRAITWAFLSTLRRIGFARILTMVIGPAHRVAPVVNKLREFPEAGLDPAYVFTTTRGLEDVDMVSLMAGLDVHHVVLVPDAVEAPSLASLRRCAGVPVAFSMVPPLAELFLQPAQTTDVGGLPLVPLGRLLHGRPVFPGKRVLDLLIGSVLLVCSLPVLAAAALAIKLDDGGPVFFQQRRVGRNGTVFKMLKLRTMRVGADRDQRRLDEHNVTNGLLFKVVNDPRVTRIGGVLRRFSVDELPQIINVLRGEMSMVGPRPLPAAPSAFGPLDGQRHVTRPGITGYWQIRGGNGLKYEEMIKLDLAYIQNWSLWLDVQLMLRTIPALFYRPGPA